MFVNIHKRRFLMLELYQKHILIMFGLCSEPKMILLSDANPQITDLKNCAYSVNIIYDHYYEERQACFYKFHCFLPTNITICHQTLCDSMWLSNHSSCQILITVLFLDIHFNIDYGAVEFFYIFIYTDIWMTQDKGGFRVFPVKVTVDNKSFG